MMDSYAIGDDAIASQELETKWGRDHSNRKKERFLKGPIPIPILHQVSHLPGKSLPLYLAIRHRSDLQRASTITLPSVYLLEWGIDKHSKRRALNALVIMGLITTSHQVGQSTRVTILEPKT
jgi:hypothetical protein